MNQKTFAVLILGLGMARSAGADTWYVPVGAPLPSDQVWCGGAASMPSVPGEKLDLGVARSAAECKAPKPVSLRAVGVWPQIDRGSLTIEVDTGRAIVRGKNLKGSVLAWRQATGGAEDVCDEVLTTGGKESCSFSVPYDGKSDASEWLFALLPEGASALADALYFDGGGRKIALSWQKPARVIVQRVLPPEPGLAMENGVGRIALLHPEAIAGADCVDALCTVEDGQLVVRDERGRDENLDVRFQLRPHVYLASGAETLSSFVSVLKLRRCNLTLLSAAPAAGLGGGRIVVRMPQTCAGGDLSMTTSDGPATIERIVSAAEGSTAIIRIERIESSLLQVRLLRGTAVIGALSVETLRAPPPESRIEINGAELQGVLPNNRDALLFVSGGAGGAVWDPVPVADAYGVEKTDTGAWRIRGRHGRFGSIAIRFALHDHRLRGDLATIDLATTTDPVLRQLRPVSLPIALDSKFVELRCGDGDGHLQPIEAGATSKIDYRARDTCTLDFHGEKLTEEDGVQNVRLNVDVETADDVPRFDKRVEKTMRIRPGRPASFAVAGVEAPFDRVIIRLSQQEGADLYTGGEAAGETIRWSLIFGKDRLRLYATAAIPTGLFRVADAKSSGILTFNAGALLRLVYLSNEGAESPIGAEAGVMWLGIPDLNASGGRGAVSLVAGLGLSVPIANASRISQTSISVHAWFEYEVSRAVLHQGGQAIGFVFGPSISVGDLGVNF